MHEYTWPYPPFSSSPSFPLPLLPFSYTYTTHIHGIKRPNARTYYSTYKCMRSCKHKHTQAFFCTCLDSKHKHINIYTRPGANPGASFCNIPSKSFAFLWPLFFTWIYHPLHFRSPSHPPGGGSLVCTRVDGLIGLRVYLALQHLSCAALLLLR